MANNYAVSSTDATGTAVANATDTDVKARASDVTATPPTAVASNATVDALDVRVEAEETKSTDFEDRIAVLEAV